MTRVAASASLSQEPAFGAAAAATVDEARRQCAAMAWLLSDVYSQSAVAKLTQPARVYLLQLCGLPSNLRGAAAQAAGLHTHLVAHHSQLAGQGDGGDGGGGGGGGCDGGGGGGPAANPPGGAPGDDTGGFPPALLSQPQLAALFALPCVEIKKLLDAAGVPHGAGIADSNVRSKGAAAAWAAEKLRSSEDICALPDGVQDRLFACFGIPSTWRPEALRHSLSMLLQACRDTA
jgi:hypothetical protein